MITPEELHDYITNDRSRLARVNRQIAYVRGNNPAILAPYPKEEPDNRIPIPFARRAVNMILGYMFKEGNIVYSGDGYDDILQETFDRNDEGLRNFELAMAALTHGCSFELHWTENGTDMFYPVPAWQSIPVYDKSIKPKMIGFIRYWTEKDYTYAVVYDDREIQKYAYRTGSKPETDGPAIDHGYGRVPIVRFDISPDASNVFDHCLPIIDFLDKILSENYANELDKLAEAILALAGRIDDTPDENGISDVDRVKQSGVMQELGDGTRSVTDLVAYITKNINPAFLESGYDRAYDLLYEMLQLPNPKETNNGEASGVAHKYRILAFEYLSTVIAMYFALGLQDRIKLIKGIGANLSVSDTNNTDVTITWNRNLPDDLAAIVDTATKADAILSRETVLGLFPSYIVPDIDEEMKRIKDQEDIFESDTSDTQVDTSDEGSEEMNGDTGTR